MLRRARRGDAEAFAELARRHGPLLYAMARRRLGDSHDAEDAVQETLLGAWRGFGRFRGQSAVRTWLVAILLRQVARVRRQRRPMTGMTQEAAARSAATPGPAVATDARMDGLAALEALSLEHREVIEMRELDGLSYQEIAHVLDVPRGTVESRLHRARQTLRKALEGYLG